MSTVSRFAPSPTGLLHLGHAFSAWTARRRADVLRLRLEDIDAARCRPEFADAILEDLRWLGIGWEGAPRVQSAQLGEYGETLARLRARGLLYPCFCSRAEIARAQAAPHAAEPLYPGTCRGLSQAMRAARMQAGAAYALRLDLAAARAQAPPGLQFYDERLGRVTAAPQVLGDVVLARRGRPTSYHLCVVHDDAAQGITHVVRGEDLLAATHVQVLLQALLGLPQPVYAHHALLLGADGKRLAKRDQAASLRGLRAAGVTASMILAEFEARAG